MTSEFEFWVTEFKSTDSTSASTSGSILYPSGVVIARVGVSTSMQSSGLGRVMFKPGVDVESRSRIRAAIIRTDSFPSGFRNSMVRICRSDSRVMTQFARSLVTDGDAGDPAYVWQPFEVEPPFGVTAQQFELKHLLSKAEAPR